MDTTVLKQVFETLQESGEVDNQNEFAEALNFTKGYVSILMRHAGSLPQNVKRALHLTYGIGNDWLASDGLTGAMRPQDMARKKRGKKKVVSDLVGLTPEQTIQHLIQLLEVTEGNNAQLMQLIEQKDKLISKLTDRLTEKNT